MVHVLSFTRGYERSAAIVIYRVPGITQLFAPVVRPAELHADIYFDMSAHGNIAGRLAEE